MQVRAGEASTGRDLARALTLRQFCEATGIPHGTAVRWFRAGDCGFKQDSKWYIDVAEAATTARLKGKRLQLGEAEIHTLPGGFLPAPNDGEPAVVGPGRASVGPQLALAHEQIDELEDELRAVRARNHELERELAAERGRRRRAELGLAAWEPRTKS